MLKILQARPQQYMNHELSDVQAGFRKGRGARDQIANIHWIIEKDFVRQKITKNVKTKSANKNAISLNIFLLIFKQSKFL